MFKVADHILVPEHQKLNKEDTEKLLQKYNISVKELPKIGRKDPAVAHLNAQPGDVIRISRKSETSGTSTYYRVVIRG